MSRKSTAAFLLCHFQVVLAEQNDFEWEKVVRWSFSFFIFIFLLSADEFYSLGSGSFYYFYTVPSSTSRYNSGLARNSSSPLSNCIPDVKSGNDCRILGLVATADVITAALVGYQLLVRLDDDRVKVLDESILLQSQSRKTGMYTSISI